MKRKELFEFEDFSWFPSLIRSCMTNLIMVFHRLVGTKEVLVSIILKMRSHTDFSQITDLGSGSGGPMIGVVEQINEDLDGDKVNLLLTDLHPNMEVVNRINSLQHDTIKYHQEKVNAMNVGEAPAGLKTMIASFHHMHPSIAQSILLSAQEEKQPILIYELAKNNIPFFLWLLLLPLSLGILTLMSMVLTLFVRPLSIAQLVFTFLIPIIPLAYAWDGQASLMRTYTFEDINDLLKEHRRANYKWEIKDALKANGKKAGYYIMGYPATPNT